MILAADCARGNDISGFGVERRVKAGEKVPAAEKIVSIFEPHTDIICRGKTISPAEFGHKVMAATGASGLVLQYEVCAGNRPDDEYFEGLVKKHVGQFGRAPFEFTADRRFYHERNEELAAAKIILSRSSRVLMTPSALHPLFLCAWLRR